MMQQYRSNSYLFGGNAPYVEELTRPPRQPGQRAGQLAHVFRQPAARAGTDGSTNRDVRMRRSSNRSPSAKANAFASGQLQPTLEMARKQVHVQLIAAYRFLGSRWADLDPLKRTERRRSRAGAGVLRPERVRHGHVRSAPQHLLRQGREHDACARSSTPARDLLRHHRRRVHAHAPIRTEKRWWQERLEVIRSKPAFTPTEEAHPRPA